MQAQGTIILQLDTKSSYLTTFACPFGRYQYKCLLFGAVPAGNIFHHKIDEIFSDMPNVFGIADDILVIGYNEDGKHHDEAVYNVLRWCKEVNLKLNRYMSFQMYIHTILWQSSIKGRHPTDPQRIKALTDMPVPNNKRELWVFLCIISYLGKFSPGTAEVCDPL